MNRTARAPLSARHTPRRHRPAHPAAHCPPTRDQRRPMASSVVGVAGPGSGTWRCGIGLVRNSRRVASPSQRAHRVDRATRALSVVIPVLAYICRFSRDTSTKATRALSDVTTRERPQTVKGLTRWTRVRSEAWSTASAMPTALPRGTSRVILTACVLKRLHDRCHFPLGDLELGGNGGGVILDHARSAPVHQLRRTQRGECREFERPHAVWAPDHRRPAATPKARPARIAMTTAVSSTARTLR
jgi:hypothetical protein